jgi:hypothetical protein
VSGEHSILPPSSADVWVKCEGSISLALLFPEVEKTEASREGTAAHWMLEQVLTNPTIKFPREVWVGGVTAPNDYPIDDDMYDAAMDVRNELIGQVGIENVRRLVVERRVELAHIHELCWGTPDMWVWDPEKRMLLLWDYKYGHGHVSAFRNYQLVAYASGILRELGVWHDPDVEVRMQIFQPRCYHGDPTERVWTIKSGELRAYVNHLVNAANLAFSPNAQTHSGDHCQHCPARHACPAAAQAAFSAVDYSGKPQPLDMTKEAVEFELAILRRGKRAIEARLSGIETVAENMLRKGAPLRGFRLEEGKTHRKWGIPDDQLLAVHPELVAPPKPMTPAQAEKNKVDASVIKQYCITPPGSLKLVEDDGSRARFLFRIKEVQ